MLRFALIALLLVVGAVPLAAQDAEIMNLRMRETAAPNERVSVQVTVRNTEDNTLNDAGQIVEDRGWRRSAGYGVGMVFTDGPSSEGEVFNHVERLTTDVPAGGRAVASWTVHVPRTPGEYTFTVTMVDDRNRPFGERVQESLFVEANHEVGWRTRVQGRARPEEAVGLVVTVENDGETNWPPGTYSVHATLLQAPSRATRDEQDQFDFTIDLGEYDWDTGASDEGEHEIVVPRTPGSYQMALEVWHDGDPLEARNNPWSYTLRIQEPAVEGAIRRIEAPRSVRAGRDARIRIHVRNTGDVTLRSGGWRVACTGEAPPGVSDRTNPFEFDLPGDGDIEVRDTETVETTIEAPAGLGLWAITCEVEIQQLNGRFEETGRGVSEDIEVTDA